MIHDILDDREKRYDKTIEYIQKYELPVICGKINYPGDDKNTKKALSAFFVLEKLLISKFKDYIVDQQILSGHDGKSILMVVSLRGEEAKKIGIDVENNHPLGRIFDIDVYKKDGASIERKTMGIENRNCLVCNGDARVCIKKRIHSLDEVISCVDEMISNYISK